MDVLRTIMDEIECVVSKVEKEEIDRVVNLIRKDRRIFVAGEGRSGFSAKGFAMRLMHLGYTVYVVGGDDHSGFKGGRSSRRGVRFRKEYQRYRCGQKSKRKKRCRHCGDE